MRVGQRSLTDPNRPSRDHCRNDRYRLGYACHDLALCVVSNMERIASDFRLWQG